MNQTIRLKSTYQYDLTEYTIDRCKIDEIDKTLAETNDFVIEVNEVYMGVNGVFKCNYIYGKQRPDPDLDATWVLSGVIDEVEFYLIPIH